MISGARKRDLSDAADLLLDARRTHAPIAQLPPDLTPVSLDEAYYVQGLMAFAYGDIGGWKIGAPAAGATPIFAPMPRAWIAPDGALLSGPGFRYRGIEAEIAFLIGQDLPPRLLGDGPAPYTRDEVLAAIVSCHPAIEELESGFIDPVAIPKFSQWADLQMHGGFVYGPPVPDWLSIDFSAEKVTLAIDGSVRVERTGSNKSGDLLHLLPYLANEGAVRTGGLRAGQWITTGSWTGNIAAGPTSRVDVTFSNAGHVGLLFV